MSLGAAIAAVIIAAVGRRYGDPTPKKIRSRHGR